MTFNVAGHGFIWAAYAQACVREPGEDRIAAIELDDALIVIVADGTGGLSGGARAAELLIELVREAVNAPGVDLARPEAWTELLSRADLVLDADPLAGEATAAVMVVSEQGSITGASCGDSGAWMVRADGTIDDLTAGQHRKLRLGSGRARPFPCSRPKLAGTLLMATDGLFNYARPDQIAAVIQHADLELAAREAIQLVRLPSGGLQDDVGVVLVRRSGR